MCRIRLPLSEETRNQLFLVKNQVLLIWISWIQRISIEFCWKYRFPNLGSTTLLFMLLGISNTLCAQKLHFTGVLDLWYGETWDLPSDSALDKLNTGFWPGKPGFWFLPTAAIVFYTWERSDPKILDFYDAFKKLFLERLEQIPSYMVHAWWSASYNML